MPPQGGRDTATLAREPAPTPNANNTSDFLSNIKLQYYDVGPPGEPCDDSDEDIATSCLRLLKQQRYGEVRALVEADRIPICQELPAIERSLLHRALHQNFNDVAPKVADVQLLLESAQRRGEALQEADLYAACRLGIPELVALLLSFGAPLGREALHHVFARCWHGRGELAQLLLGARASVNSLCESDRCSPLTALCLGLPSGFKANATWLLDRRADPNGSGGSCLPLHSLVGGLINAESAISLLVERRADVNLREPLAGSAPIHVALEGHTRWSKVLELKSLGADCSLVNETGLTPAQMLLKAGLPEQAAQLEDRPMNDAERRVCAARDHPAAKAFSRSLISELGWLLSRPLDGLDDEELETPISDLMLGHCPQSVVLDVPLTRYSELRDDLEITASGPDGFRVKDLLQGLYVYYQAPFSKAQTSRIQRHFDRRHLGDTFGYIQRNIPATVGADGEEEAKRPAVARIELRGDSIYYEGFGDCKYFEDDRRLYGLLRLGS